MESNVNGCRKYFIDEKIGTAEEIVSFYPETYLNNKNHPEYYTPLNIDEIICDFIIKEKLGEGAFGSVRLGINKQTGEKVAIKILEKSKLNRNIDKIRLQREMEILKKLRHPNIVQLYSVIETERQIFLIMEYIKGQELFQYILLKKKLPEDEACFYFQQIISGIEYLQKLKISHRDIKSENILIEQNSKVIKIIDFGLSNIYGDKDNEILTSACGSPFYAPPEMLKGSSYRGSGVDIWSVGVVLFAMICGYLPFEGEDNDKLYKKIIDGKFSIPTHVSGQARELIYQLLNTNPRKRINISQIKKHPWIKFYGNGLSNNGEPIFNNGLYIDKYVIPIDEDIIDEMEKKFKLSKIKSRINVLTNKANDYTTLYYLLLQQKINDGKKSVSDLKSDLFLNYIKDKKNLLSYYKNNIKNVIKDRKLGISLKEENIDTTNNHHLDKNNKNIKSQYDIKIQNNNQKIQKLLTPINKSGFYLKTNIINQEKNIKINNNRNIKKNTNSTSPLKKTKSKMKFHNVDEIKSKKKEKSTNNHLDTMGSNTTKNEYNHNKLSFNNNIKLYNKISPRSHNSVLSPNYKRKQNDKISTKNYKLEKSNNSIYENKNNKTDIMNNKNKYDINIKKIKKENIKIKIPEKQKENEQSINENINNNKDDLNIENGGTIKNNNDNNKNIYINIEERSDDNQSNINDKKINNEEPDNKSKTISKLNQNNECQKTISTNSNLITEEKIKYAQTLDSFSMPKINQEEYQFTSNNFTLQNIVEMETSIPPQTETDINIDPDNKRANNKNEKQKNKKEIKAKFIKKNIYGYNYKKNKIKKTDMNNNNKSLSKKRNCVTQKKILYKKIDGNDSKRKYIDDNKSEKYSKIYNDSISKYKSKRSNNNSKYKDSYNYMNNLSSFNPIKEFNDMFIPEDNYDIDKKISVNNIKIENIKIKKNNKRHYKYKKFNSMDTEITKLNKTGHIDKEDYLIKINTITHSNQVNSSISFNTKKNYKKHNNKFSSPTIIDYKMNIKNAANKYNNNFYKKVLLNKNDGNSISLFNRNDLYQRNKILSNIYTPKSNTLYKNLNFSIGNIDIKNKPKNINPRNNNDLLGNLKEYFSFKDKVNNNNNNNYAVNSGNGAYEPFDLNCLFILPRKVIKEKILNIFENIKCRVKQINAYKYNISYKEKRIIYEFSLPLNNKGIVKFKKISGINKEFANDVRKIVYGLNK